MAKKPFYRPKPAAPRPASSNNPQQRRQQGPASKELHAINDRIRAREVRLVGENVEQGIYSIQEALRIADELELDLVEISPNAEPPVCKILDYQKFLYQQKKHQKEQKAKAKTDARQKRNPAGNAPNNKFNNFDSRSYDMEDLERKLLQQ